MDSKKIAMLILIFAIICAAAFMIMTQHNSTQKNITSTNNTTNITKNTTNVTNVTNATPEYLNFLRNKMINEMNL